uniref:Uncharacterized protein n=1 Tax=Strombidium inclinatum TaxID=197538 RepID=A0A7S3MRA0_9SPIT
MVDVLLAVLQQLVRQLVLLVQRMQGSHRSLGFERAVLSRSSLRSRRALGLRRDRSWSGFEPLLDLSLLDINQLLVVELGLESLQVQVDGSLDIVVSLVVLLQAPQVLLG